jgi:hypothetical protein
MGGIVVVRRFQDRFEAMVARSALEASGIQCWLPEIETVSVAPHYNIALGGCRLLVAEEDLEAAIAALQSEPLDQGDDAENA